MTFSTKVEQLITCLKQIETELPATDYLTVGYESDFHPLVLQALTLANEVLITPKGNPNYYIFPFMKANGFTITKGESDSFGWLSGCIHTTKGIIVFG